MNFKNNFTIEQIRTFWNKTAVIYEKENAKVSQIHHQRFSAAMPYFKFNERDKILNIWSRTGAAIPYLKNKESKIFIYNLEVSEEMLGLAQKKFPEENFFLTDLAALNFPNNFFNHALSLETLEHCPDPLLFLKELYRTLKPGGRLVMSAPPASCEAAYRLYTLLGFGHGEGPHKFPSSKTVKEMLRLAGFKLLSHKGTLLIPIGPRLLKSWGEKLINRYQNTFIKELGIRQFYICQK